MSNRPAVEYYNDGLQRAKEKRWDEAIELLKKAIAEDPKHANSYNVLGKVYAEKGEIDAASKYWRKALRIDPDNVTTRQCLTSIGREPAKTRFGALFWPAFVFVLFASLVATNSIFLLRISKLKSELTRVTTPKDQDSRLKTQHPGREIQGAGDQKSQEVQPVRPTSETSVERPQMTKPPVRAVLKSAPETASEVEKVYNQALVDCMSGRYNQAIESFQQILEYPQPHQLKDNAQYWLAECYYAQKNYDQALAEFQKVRRNFPKANKAFDAELKVAYTYYKLGRIEECEKKLSQLSKDWPHEQYQSKIAILSEKIQSR